MGGMKSQTQPQIRTFAPEDYNSILQLWQASGLRIKASDTLAELRKLDQDLFLVAEKIQGGLIVGAVIGAWDGRRAWIYHLAVSPTARRTGIGSLLMSEVEKRLRARGALKINLLVESDNLKARSFYRSLSYEEMPFVFFTKEI